MLSRLRQYRRIHGSHPCTRLHLLSARACDTHSIGSAIVAAHPCHLRTVTQIDIDSCFSTKRSKPANVIISLMNQASSLPPHFLFLRQHLHHHLPRHMIQTRVPPLSLAMQPHSFKTTTLLLNLRHRYPRPLQTHLCQAIILPR